MNVHQGIDWTVEYWTSRVSPNRGDSTVFEMQGRTSNGTVPGHPGDHSAIPFGVNDTVEFLIRSDRSTRLVPFQLFMATLLFRAVAVIAIRDTAQLRPIKLERH